VVYTLAHHWESPEILQRYRVLDVASCAIAQEYIKAEAYFSKEDNALNQNWLRSRAWILGNFRGFRISLRKADKLGFRIMNLRHTPVQISPCRSCPFAGKKPVQLSSERYAEFIENLCGNGQHFCHSASDRKICRGGRNIQLRWLFASNMISEPTDDAFYEALDRFIN